MSDNKATYQNAIDIRNLTKNYGKHRGVQDLHLEVAAGDIFGFLGPNGAGKSTTIRCMLGMLRFGQGEIRLLGKDCVGRDRHAEGDHKSSRPGHLMGRQWRELMNQVGYMPSEAAFYPGMKVRDVIRFAARCRQKDCSREADRLCGILEVEGDKRVEELSLGNRKKVSIVCAMQHKPKLLILDEPTSGLDPLMQDAFWGLVSEYNSRGTTCFLSSHVLSEVKQYCRNAAVIREGRLIRADSVENLCRSNLRKVRMWEDGKETAFSHTGTVEELLHRLEGRRLEDLLIEEPSLEEVFMHYFREE